MSVSIGVAPPDLGGLARRQPARQPARHRPPATPYLKRDTSPERPEPTEPEQAPEDQRAEVAGISVGERLQLLASVPLLGGLQGDQLLPLAAGTQVEVFAAGEPIVRQGEPGDSIYLIASGWVQVLTRVEHNGIVTEAVVSWLGPGEALGELSLLDGEPRSASCIAGTRSVCLRLSRGDFLAALEQHWPLSRALLAVLAQRLRRADARLAEQARDPLTGLYSRRALGELYEREVARAQRALHVGAAHGLAMLFADVDRFKEINDSHGHHTGDAVLRSVARTLTAATRATDLVARHGGDEFVILLLDACAAGVAHVVERIRATLREQPPGPVPFTLSLGAALVDPGQPQPLETLLAEADRAMYEDKGSRREP